MKKAQHCLDVGYQRVLTFECSGGGFDWHGQCPASVWLTAYGLQQLTATSKVHEIDTRVIERAYRFLAKQQRRDGGWDTPTRAGMLDSGLALSAYVTWALAEAGYKDAIVTNAVSYLKSYHRGTENPYLLGLMANAFVAAQEPAAKDILAKLEETKSNTENTCFWEYSGQTHCYAYGNAADIETTALVVYAMLTSSAPHAYTATINKAINYLIEQRSPYGTWGSTQATILALKTLVASEVRKSMGGEATVNIFLDKQPTGTWHINDANREVVQLLDLKDLTRPGKNLVELAVAGNANVMYQLVSRYWQPWNSAEALASPLEITVVYDRHQVAKGDTITATATMRYHGSQPTYMIILNLGIPPGFSLESDEFERLVAAKQIQRYAVNQREVTIYLGAVNPEQTFQCRYRLKARYPLRVKTPKSEAYEYYSPQVRAESQPVELVVGE